MPQSIATGIATETIGMSWGAINYMLSKHNGSAIDFKAFRTIVPFTTLGAGKYFEFILTNYAF